MQERELNLREPGDRDLLASEWLSYAESGKEDRFWAYETLADLIDDDPALACSICLELLHRASSDGAFDVAATGPLEDLVAWHGRDVIDLIDQRVEGDSALRKALARLQVGRDTLDPTTLERLWSLGVPRI
jgi:hypothetical protein